MSIDQRYAANRDAFCKTALQNGAKLYHIPYADGSAPDLVTDVAVLGNENAQNIVITTSGLHGVELPAGSMVQRIGLEKIREADLADTKFVFVHALNPYGAFHAARTDCGPDGERNIDPARNFIDFSSPKIVTPPADPAIEAAFADAKLSGSSQTMMWGRLLYAAFVKLGRNDFKRNFVQGQYSNPLLPYYGGNGPSYTRLTWEKIINEEARYPSVRNIYHFDCHSGDGPFGMLQIYLCGQADGNAKDLAHKLTRPDKIQNVDEYFANITGDIGDYWATLGFPPEVQIYPVTLEFGTTQTHIPGIDVLGAILNRTLLSEKYHDDHPLKDTIIQRMRDVFCPPQDEWEWGVVAQSHEIWENLLKGNNL
ncbi:MAG TPA: M14 family metallopeptidase [Alphaproteobacteria bacterium]|nr:M14 family metallopeptidase [Alphaproteobacteria bacterium]HNS44644.1 M14 family metallopeptidase [Alphaproteobacteria bacterium]